MILTISCAALALLFTNATLDDVVFCWRGKESWNKGFWAFLEFSMQMCLILVTGYALADAPPVRSAIKALASIPKTTAQAAVTVSVISMLTAYLNWGLSLIVGAILARDIAAHAKINGRIFHYPLLAAAGYFGLMVWHGGLSGSGPLDLATSGVKLEGSIYKAEITKTIFQPANICLSLALLFIVPLILSLIANVQRPLEIELSGDKRPEATHDRSFAAILERSFVLSLLFCTAAFYIIFSGFSSKSLSFIDLYSVPFIFLFLGLLLHFRPSSYVESVSKAAGACGGIIIQFPFYAGIMGIMSNTGLSDVISGLFQKMAGTLTLLGLSNQQAFALSTFINACFINMFVPSGGGQWKVQGPPAVQAGYQLGVAPEKTCMYIAYGDELTNMIQPFWALALLGITGLKVHQIMPYSAVVMILVFPIYAIAVILL